MEFSKLTSEKQKMEEKQKQYDDEAALKKQIYNEEKKAKAAKEVVQTVVDIKKSDREDFVKTEKKAEALLLQLSDDTSAKKATAQLENQILIEKPTVFRTALAYANSMRIFLKEIAGSKIKIKQQKTICSSQ